MDYVSEELSLTSSDTQEAVGIDDSPSTIEEYSDWENKVVDILLNEYYLPPASFLSKPNAAWACAFIHRVNPNKFAFDTFWWDG